MFKVLVANTPIAQMTAWHAFVVSGNLLQLVCELVTCCERALALGRLARTWTPGRQEVEHDQRQRN